MGARAVLLHKVKKNVYLLNDSVYLDAVIKLYPKYADIAIDNYLKILEKKHKY